MPGRPRKPQELKELDGDIHKERWNHNAPKPENARPTCPRHVRGPALTEWRRIVPKLEKLNLLTENDRAELAMYCVAWGHWVEIENQIAALQKQKGNPLAGQLAQSQTGEFKISALVRLSEIYYGQMHRALIEFGMTPASRTRISVTPPSKQADPMEALFEECAREQGGR